MKAIFFNKYQFEKIKNNELKLSKNIRHVESELYLITKPLRYHEKQKKFLLKKFYITEGEYFSNKLATINSLIELSSKVDIKSLIFPTELVILDGKIVGYLMPYIEGANLITLLEGYELRDYEKIKLLTEIGLIIEKVHNYSKHKSEFFLGDIHEANFILDANRQIRVTDLDSCKLKNNFPYPSKYLASNPNLEELKEKYPINEQGIHIPNYNTDLYCYMCMILNTIAKTDVSKLSMEDYYFYLEYLISLGFGYDFIRCFAEIYIHKDNTSPLPFLNQVPEKFGEVAYYVYQYKKNKTKRK